MDSATAEVATAEWLIQLRKGVLELCILGLISDRPRYGYEIVSELGSAARLAAGEGTIYPLLRRLRRAGLVETFWQESPAGPPRQYYQLTASGSTTLHSMRQEWRQLVGAVAAYIAEERSKHARAR